MRRPAVEKRFRLLIGIVLAVLVAGGATTAWALNRTPSSTKSTTTTTLIAATTTTLRQTVATTGTIDPATEADLSFGVSGTVMSVPVTVGTVVGKGTLLATLGTTDLQASVDSAQAAVDAAQQQVTSVASGTTAQQASAQAQLASAQNKLTVAQQSLAAARMTSPIAGTVAAVNIATGDAVGGGSGSGGSGSGGSGSGGSGSGSFASSGPSGTSNSTSSSAQIVVISTGSWVVNASVGSADLASVKKGLQVEITPTGSNTRLFGLVDSVGIVASSSSGGSATFPVRIVVTGTPTGLYAGGSADVTIIVKQLQNVLTVPTAAIHSTNGSTVVYQQKSGKQVSTPVTVGTVFGGSTQILSGLKAGDQVMVSTFGGGTGTSRRTGTTGTGRTGTGTGGGFGGGGGGFGGGGGGFGGGSGFGGGN